MSGFDFIPAESRVKRDYSRALRNASAALSGDDAPTWYVITPADLGLSDDATYNAPNTAKAIDRLVKAGALPFVVKHGTTTMGVKVAAVSREQ